MVTAQLALPLLQPAREGQPFRPVQYLGSKLRLLSEILVEVRGVAEGRVGPVCDLFSGSGVVSHALSQLAPVVSVDIQEYSRVIASGLLRGAAAAPDILEQLTKRARRHGFHEALLAAVSPLIKLESACISEAEAGTPERLHLFIEHASLHRFTVEQRECPAWIKTALSQSQARLEALSRDRQAACQITRYYGGAYFSFSQAVTLDVLRFLIAKLDEPEHDVALGALLSAASAVANTVGKQFAQPIRLRKSDGAYPKVLVERAISDRNTCVFETYDQWLGRWTAAVTVTGKHQHQALKCDYSEFLSKRQEPLSAVYADPPYTIDHYSRFYHVLETLCLYDEPVLATMRKHGTSTIMRGLYRSERFQSPFCIPSTVERAFNNLLSGVARLDTPLILSYSPNRSDGLQRPRLMDLQRLLAMARKWFAKVELIQLSDHAHRKLNAESNNRDSLGNTEMLLRCGG